MSNTGGHYGWVEIVLSAVVALGFGGYQLWSVKREIRRDRQNRRDGAAQDRNPPDPSG